MLILSRFTNDQVFLTLPNGEVITVTIVEVRNGKVRVGFEAPQDVEILRDDAIDKTPKPH